MPVQSIKLANGSEIPQVGLGLWLVKDESECKQAVSWALDAGYAHFDTAQSYGNEAFLGATLQERAVSRDEIFITTKIANNNQPLTKISASFDQSLTNLQTDYVDLLLLHFPVTETRQQAWPKMEEILRSGKAREIGVSNYTISHLTELLRECDVKPAVNQVELHVFLQQYELIEYCKDNGIVVEAYSPLAHGYGIDNPALLEIARKYDKRPAQVMIRWCIDHGLVALPKSVRESRIKENMDVFDFSLSKEDLERLKALDSGYRASWDPTDVP